MFHSRAHRTPNQTNTQYTAQRRIIWICFVYSVLLFVRFGPFVEARLLCALFFVFARVYADHIHKPKKDNGRLSISVCIMHFIWTKLYCFWLVVLFFSLVFLILLFWVVRGTEWPQNHRKSRRIVWRFAVSTVCLGHTKREETKKKHRSVLINQHYIAQRL